MYCLGAPIIKLLKSLIKSIGFLQIIESLFFCLALNFLKVSQTEFLAFFVVEEMLVFSWENVDDVVNLSVKVESWRFGNIGFRFGNISY